MTVAQRFSAFDLDLDFSAIWRAKFLLVTRLAFWLDVHFCRFGFGVWLGFDDTYAAFALWDGLELVICLGDD